MRKVLEALRLLFDHDRNQREIATSLALSQSTVQAYIRRFQAGADHAGHRLATALKGDRHNVVFVSCEERQWGTNDKEAARVASFKLSRRNRLADDAPAFRMHSGKSLRLLPLPSGVVCERGRGELRHSDTSERKKRRKEGRRRCEARRETQGIVGLAPPDGLCASISEQHGRGEEKDEAQLMAHWDEERRGSHPGEDAGAASTDVKLSTFDEEGPVRKAMTVPCAMQ